MSLSVWAWWVLSCEVLARSSLSVHSSYQQDSTNNDPVPPEQSPHTEPGIVVPEPCASLSQMEQTSHKQLQVTEMAKMQLYYLYLFIQLSILVKGSVQGIRACVKTQSNTKLMTIMN